MRLIEDELKIQTLNAQNRIWAEMSDKNQNMSWKIKIWMPKVEFEAEMSDKIKRWVENQGRTNPVVS